MCQTTLYLQFSECEDSHLFDITLDPLTKYYYSIVDKFGNKYNGEVVTDLSGYFSLNNSDFLPYLFNKNAGNFTLTLKENSASCDYLNIVKCGNIYGNIVFSFISKNEVLVPNLISSYTVGTSTIDFINNGGDDWTIGLKLNPDSQQLPIGYSIDSYDYIIDFWNGSGRTPLYGGTAITAPTTTLNTSGNGAGTYSMQVIYNATNGIDTKTFSIWNLIEVDASGNVVDYVKMDGMTVNSVSGLTMSVTANITQSQSYPITWVTSPTYAEIGTGVSPTLTLNVDADMLGYGVTLGPEFPDFTSAFGVESSVTIN